VKLEAAAEKMTVWVDNNRILSSQDSRLKRQVGVFDSIWWDRAARHVKVFEEFH